MVLASKYNGYICIVDIATSGPYHLHCKEICAGKFLHNPWP